MNNKIFKKLKINTENELIFGNINNSPILSVVISFFNKMPYTAKTIESILSQEVNFSIEILIIDDKSQEDNYLSLKRFIQELNERDRIPKLISIRLLKQNKNCGLVLTRNMGILKSKGKFVFLLDADDYLIKNNVLSKLVKSLSNGANISYVNLENVDQNGNFMESTQNFIGKFKYLTNNHSYPHYFLLERSTILMSQIAFNKDLLNQVGNFSLLPYIFGEDNILFLKLFWNKNSIFKYSSTPNELDIGRLVIIGSNQISGDQSLDDCYHMGGQVQFILNYFYKFQYYKKTPILELKCSKDILNSKISLFKLLQYCKYLLKSGYPLIEITFDEHSDKIYIDHLFLALKRRILLIDAISTKDKEKIQSLTNIKYYLAIKDTLNNEGKRYTEDYPLEIEQVIWNEYEFNIYNRYIKNDDSTNGISKVLKPDFNYVQDNKELFNFISRKIDYLYIPSTKSLYSKWIKGEITAPWEIKSNTSLFAGLYPLLPNNIHASSFHFLYLKPLQKSDFIVLKIPVSLINLSELKYRCRSNYWYSHTPEFAEFFLPYESKLRVSDSISIIEDWFKDKLFI